MFLIAIPAALVAGFGVMVISYLYLAPRRSPKKFQQVVGKNMDEELDLPAGMKQEECLDPADREALKQAFVNGSNFQWMSTKPGETSYEQDALRAISFYMIECCLAYVEKYGYMLVQRDEQGHFQGSICLIPPCTNKSWFVRNTQFLLAVIPLGRPVPEEFECGKRFNDFTTTMTKKHKELMKTTDNHWYVQNLGVALEHQGKGVGRKLLQVAEKYCLPTLAEYNDGGIYFECIDQNVPFYEKMGYITKERFQLSTPEDGDPFFYNAMILKPQRQTS